MADSRLDELIQALINGTSSEIIPQSRVEEILLAVINGQELPPLEGAQSSLEALLIQEGHIIEEGGGGSLVLDDLIANANGLYTPEAGHAYKSATVNVADVPYDTGDAHVKYLHGELTEIPASIRDKITHLDEYAMKSFQGDEIYLPECRKIETNTFNGVIPATKIYLPKAHSLSMPYFNGGATLELVCLRLVNVATGIFPQTAGFTRDAKVLRFPEASGFCGATSATANWFTHLQFYDAGLTATIGTGNASALKTLILRQPDFVVPITKAVSTQFPVLEALYVPAALVDAYKAAEYWSDFSEYIYDIESHPEVCEWSYPG